ncbi:MAG: hypothetical protein ABSA65_17085 [Acidimicrobiales bacterium]|jgi:hypothetical protein
MRLGKWPYNQVEIGDEHLLLTQQCSDKFGKGLLAMVAGQVHVTSGQVIFIPNFLGILVGRMRWSYPIVEISETRREVVELGRGFGPASALKLTILRRSSAETLTKTLVMPRAEHADELLSAIERARGRW